MSNKKRCAHVEIGKDIGWDGALFLEWLRFCVAKKARFLTLIEMNGETWITNSTPDLNRRAELFDLSPSGKPKKLEGVIGKLIKEGLLRSTVFHGNTRLIAIDTAAIASRYGEEIAATFSMTEDDTEEDEKRNTSVKTEAGSAKTEAPLYIVFDSSKENSKEESKSSASSDEEEGAAPSEISPAETFEKPANTFLAVAQIAYHGFAIDKDIRKEIGTALAKINNTRRRGMQVLVDVELMEDYAVWRMLVDKKGWQGFPTAEAFAREFSYEFLAWYESQTNKQTLQRIKQQFPSWRQDLFARDSDYVAFRKTVQDALYPKKTKGSVVDRHPWKQDRQMEPSRILTDEERQAALARAFGPKKETGS